MSNMREQLHYIRRKGSRVPEDHILLKKTWIVPSRICSVWCICGCFESPDEGIERAGTASIAFDGAFSRIVSSDAFYISWGGITERGDQKLWNLTVNHRRESLDKKDRDAGTETYSSTTLLLLEYKTTISRPVWGAKLRGMLDVWFE